MAINPACNALTTLSRLRAAGFGGQASEDALQLAINAVSDAVRNYCGRTFHRVKYGDGNLPAELLQGSGRNTLLLSNYPILKVYHVVVDGIEVTDWQLIPDQAEWGALWRHRGWPRREGRWGSLVSDPDGQAKYNIEISYEAGFSEVPADLEMAVMREVDIYAPGSGGRASRALRSERTPGGWSIAWRDDREGQFNENAIMFSLSSIAVFERYKRRDI